MIRTYHTTKGLNYQALPFRLYQKAKKFGQWDPRDIDFSQDKVDWATFNPLEQDYLLTLLASFQAGEEAVTGDIMPLAMAIAKEGRFIEEEMYLTTFIFEEAKHVEFFRLFLDEVGITEDLSTYHGPVYREIFNEILPAAMNRLLTDQSPEAIAEAAVTYNMFVEGILAETGYESFFKTFSLNQKLPGLIKGIQNLKRDESRHIGYGTYLLQRLISEHDHLYDVIMQKLSELVPYSTALINENYNKYEEPPFTTDIDEFLDFAIRQYSVRLSILDRARGKKIEELYRMQEEEVGLV